MWTHGASTHTTSYLYDDANRRTRMTDPAGNTDWTYDAAGRIDTITYPSTDVYNYDYNKAGGLTQLTYPDTSTVDYGYDQANRLVTVDSSTIGLTTYTLDGDGRIDYEALPGTGNYRDPEYGTDGRLETLTETIDTVTNVWGLVYDNRGRITQHNLGTASSGDDDTVYTYDNADQLLTATVGNPNTANDRVYTYTNGRRTAQTWGDGTSFSYTYNAIGSMLTETIDSTTYNYTYDDAGRQLTNDRNGITQTTTYDPRGRIDTITAVDGTDTTVEERTYDGDGHLRTIDLTHPDTSTDTYELTWNINSSVPQIVSRTDSANTDYLIYGTNRIGYDDTTPALFSYDALANTLTTTNTADLTRSETFDPYGDPTGASASTDAHAPQFGYRSETHLTENIHLRARDLDPTVGAFTTVDPLPPVPGTPVTANPYHYANNDPIKMADPLGLRATDAEIAAACAGVGGRIVSYGSDGLSVCMEPPSSGVEGSPCFPSHNSKGVPVIFHRGTCQLMDEVVTCKRLSNGLTDMICRNGSTIKRIAGGVAIGAALVATAGAASGFLAGAPAFFVPTGGLAAVGISSSGAGAIALSPAALELLTIAGTAAATIGGTSILMQESGGSGGESSSGPLRGSDATEAARQLGYTTRIPPQRAPFNSHGMPVFSNGRNFITPDRSAHIGGVWKMMSKQGVRLGTFDALLRRIGP